MLFYFAIDESRGTDEGYDRLYFDLNRDLDLRNDPVVLPQRHPPDHASLPYSNTRDVIFEPLSIEFDLGPAGTRPVQIMPRLSTMALGDLKQMTFVRTTLYKGDIALDGDPYQALLGDAYIIRGRLDHPGTALLLSAKDRDRRQSWLGGSCLKAAPKIHGRFYMFSASPTGEELTVRPYQGDLGTFEVGPGGRQITNLAVSGSLESKDAAVPVGGEFGEGARPEKARRCQIPVGDYAPSYIMVEFGRLSLGISYNYHSEGKPRARGGRALVHGLMVRKDRPCVLDFSNKPDVMFASPSCDQPFKPGDTIEVKAVLVDPKLDFMVRGLNDTTQRKSDGRYVSLDPKVLITRADGEKVAEGVMPFG